MFIIDAHQDLAWNMLSFGRDYTRSALERRQRESGSSIPSWNDDSVVGWSEYQQGQVAAVFATLFAAPERRREGLWEKVVYQEPRGAQRLYRQQLDLYHRLVEEHSDKFILIQSRNDLQAVLSPWQSRSLEPVSNYPVGLVVLMEGAEGILETPELEEWWARGLRLIGPAWARNRYCGGTREPGALTSDGIELLETMGALGFGLDISHMDEKAALQAIDRYEGTILASHSNAQALLKEVESNRHLSDTTIRALVERDGAVGVCPSNPFLLAGWKRGDRRSLVSIDRVVAQIDYICQMAGDATHAAIGSDFDGGFGLQSIPIEMDTIADLQKLAPLLSEKGYSPQDIAAIFGQNWVRILQRILPEKI